MVQKGFENMKRHRYKQKKKKTGSLLSSAISLIFLTFFFAFFDESKKIFHLMLMLDAAAAFVIALTALGIWLIKKRKRKQYLSSSLYKIDKMDGKIFEEYLAAHFHSLGYKVTLTPASNDYGADLLLSKDGEKIAVQAKRYNGKVSNAAIQEVSAAMRYYKCDKGMVITNSFFTSNAVKLAKECDIELWDRNDLKNKFRAM